MPAKVEFAIVDVETTGFSPAKSDRVVEIAVVRVDSSGRVLDEYATLVNPHRDVGPTHIHGVSARQLRHAPDFADIAEDVSQRLEGAVFTAHNARFDMGFVTSEMKRAGVSMQEHPSLCTMRLVRLADPSIGSRKLNQVCEHFGIATPNAHSALGDARATASLLSACIVEIRGCDRVSSTDLDSLGVEGALTEMGCWQAAPLRGKTCRREDATTQCVDDPSYIASLVAKLPLMNSATPEMDDYFALLDRVLEDRRVTAEEAEALSSMASELGIAREHAIAAHEQYVADLTHLALSDGILTDSERTDIAEVRRLLDVSEERTALRFADVGISGSRHADTAKSSTMGHARELVGRTICFTGELCCRISGQPVSRENAETIATGKGMVVKRNVTKKLDFLVVADPDSMSGKTEKARRYGLRVIAEPVFWRMVGVSTD